MIIAAVGDIMPGGLLSGINEGYVSQEILDILADADIRVGTLETAIGNEPTFYEEKMHRKADVIYAKDADLIKLKDLHIDIVSLANNHFFDLGPEGANHAISLLDSLGIMHIGAGRNLEEASKPVVMKHEGKTIAFLGFCDWREENVGWCPIASETQPGVCPMYDDYVIGQIKNCKSQYDFVVVMPHWGREYQQAPTHVVYKLASNMIKAGADVVLGSHTHCVQPVIKKHGVIAFSMGNFLFPDRLITSPRSTYYSNTPLDISSLPVTYSFPEYVETVTLKRWRGMARYGQIVSADISKRRAGIEYTKLSDNNIVSLAGASFPYSRRMKIMKWLMQCNLYLPLLWCGRTAIQLKSKVNKVFHTK